MYDEGVIKYALRFTPAPAVRAAAVRELGAWRRLLRLTRLVGQEEARYGGFGFGNLSQRIAPFHAPRAQRRFLITGTQTGELAELGPEHYATVLSTDPQRNLVHAEGPIQPSSESLTHGVLYALDNRLRFVFHVHAPEIWRHARTLAIPATRKEVAYGTPQMAEEVRRLFRDHPTAVRRVFAMGGHEDGVISFGTTAAEAGNVLIDHLTRAFQL